MLYHMVNPRRARFLWKVLSAKGNRGVLDCGDNVNSRNFSCGYIDAIVVLFSQKDCGTENLEIQAAQTQTGRTGIATVGGHPPVGAKLPAERDLAIEYDCNFLTVRKRSSNSLMTVSSSGGLAAAPSSQRRMAACLATTDRAASQSRGIARL